MSSSQGNKPVSTSSPFCPAPFHFGNLPRAEVRFPSCARSTLTAQRQEACILHRGSTVLVLKRCVRSDEDKTVSTLLSAIKCRWWDLLNGFWFVPGLISLCGLLLALLFLWLDHVLGTRHLPFLFTGDATAASGLLSAIAA